MFSDSGAGYFLYVEQALQWVIGHAYEYDIGVVNLSLGDGGNWQTEIGRYGLGDEFATLASMDVLVIAASGNNYYTFDSEPGVSYPAADPYVISVGAVWSGDYGGPWHFANGAADYTTGADHVTSFTQRDDELLDVLAPGSRLAGANASGGTSTMQGTSQASAYLAGVATLAQDIAMDTIGRRLHVSEFVSLLADTGRMVFDGDDENDDVANSGVSFPRVDVLRLAEAILALDDDASTGGGDTGGDTGGGTGIPVPSAGHSLTIGAGDHRMDVDFGNFKLGTISGTVFEDVDGDGTRDLPTDQAIAGRTVWLDDGDGVFEVGETNTQTDAQGAYSFADLGPGSYAVRQLLPPGWNETGAGSPVVVTMTSALAATADFSSFSSELNQAPVAHDDAYTVDEDHTLTVAASAGLLANDTDADPADTLTAVLVSGPSHGSLTVNADGSFSYTPVANFHLGDSFTYRVSDGTDVSAVATVTIDVIAQANSAPVARDDSKATTATSPVTIAVLGNDTDPDPGFVLGLVSFDTSSALGAGVTTDGTGKLIYNPTGAAALVALAAGEQIVDTFTYTIADEFGAQATATVSVLVTGVNDAPLGVADSDAADEDTVKLLSVLDNDTDVDNGHLLSIVGVQALSAKGALLSVSADGQQVVYDPQNAAKLQALAEGAELTDTFKYTLADEYGRRTTAVVTLVVSGRNDAPVATDDAATTRKTTAVNINVLGNDRDADAGAALHVDATFPIVSAKGATVTLNANGTLKYDPGSSAELQALGAGETATDTFTYVVADENGATDTATVTVAVGGTTAPAANRRPVAGADSAATDEDSAVDIDIAGNDADPDGQPVATSLPAKSALGASLSLNPDGTVHYDPAAALKLQALAEGGSATDTFTYTITDPYGLTARATVTITVQGENDNPVANADNRPVQAGRAVQIDAISNDKDPDTGAVLSLQSFAPIAGVTRGALSLDPATGKIVYDPTGVAEFRSLAAGETATDSFSYVVADGHGGTATGTVFVTVSGVNDAPVAVADDAATDEDTAIVIDALANDLDPDTGAVVSLYAVGATSSLGATLTRVGDSIHYDPTGAGKLQALAAGETITDTFRYFVIDEFGARSVATATIVVTGRNDAPSAHDDIASTSAARAVNVNVLRNDKDVDHGAILSVDPGTLPAFSAMGAALTIDGDGSVRYDPTPSTDLQAVLQGTSVVDTFTYRATDQFGVTSTATVSVNVAGTAPAAASLGWTASGASLLSASDTDVTQAVAADDDAEAGRDDAAARRRRLADVAAEPEEPILIDIGQAFTDFEFGHEARAAAAPWQADFATVAASSRMASANQALRLSVPV